MQGRRPRHLGIAQANLAVNYPLEREKVPPAPQSKKTPAIPRVQNRRPMLREEDPICTRVSTCGDDILATEDLVFLQLGGPLSYDAGSALRLAAKSHGGGTGHHYTASL